MKRELSEKYFSISVKGWGLKALIISKVMMLWGKQPRPKTKIIKPHWCSSSSVVQLNWGQKSGPVQPRSLWGCTNYHFQAAAHSLVRPPMSCLDSFSLSHSFSPPVIILTARPPSSSHSSSLRPHPLLFLIHFSCTASPSFNRYHYADASPLHPLTRPFLQAQQRCPERLKAQPPEAIKHFQGWLVIKAEALHLYCLGGGSYHEHLINKPQSLS